MALTPDLFQRLEEVEANQGVASLNFQLSLNCFDVLEVLLKDAGDLCIDHADHDVPGHVRAALQLLRRLGRVDHGADADHRALVLARPALPDPVLVLEVQVWFRLSPSISSP